MRRSSWVVLGLIAVLAAGLIYARTAGRPKLTDEEQIQALLTKGQSAIERENLKDAFSCVSRSYSDSAGMTFDALRLQVARAFQERGRYDVMLENASISVNGDEAKGSVDVVVDLASTGSRNRVYAGRLGMDFRKEESRQWLMIPVHTWKITEISGLSAVTGEAAGF